MTIQQDVPASHSPLGGCHGGKAVWVQQQQRRRDCHLIFMRRHLRLRRDSVGCGSIATSSSCSLVAVALITARPWGSGRRGMHGGGGCNWLSTRQLLSHSHRNCGSWDPRCIVSTWCRSQLRRAGAGRHSAHGYDRTHAPVPAPAVIAARLICD